MTVPYELSDRAWNAGSLNDACAITAAEELRRLAEDLATPTELITRANELDPDGAL